MDLLGMPAAHWLPLAFAVLMGVSILAYVVLDGYDLGVGILMARADRAERDMMVASIGPFWDANETWLVLGIGILLVAFPVAHGFILGALYLPVALMLLGLTMRGVAFEFRVKAQTHLQGWWDRAFVAGSALTAITQGYMLGAYIMGFQGGWAAHGFALLTGVCLAAGYAFIGATWLILKTEGELQARAVRFARTTLWLTALGMVAVSLATPLVSPRIFEKWFAFPRSCCSRRSRSSRGSSSWRCGCSCGGCRGRTTRSTQRPSSARTCSSCWPSSASPTRSIPTSCQSA